MGTNSEVPKDGREAIRNILGRLTVLERKPNNLPDVSAFKNPDTLAVRNADGNVQTGTPVVADDAVPLGYLNQALPSGVTLMWPSQSAPSGWLVCNGQAVSRTTYASLFARLNFAQGAVTITIASPAVLTLTAHGRQTGQRVYLTTTGSLPTGLSVNTVYYAIRIDANTLNLATSQANALAGTAINTSGSQSGTHTLNVTWGLGDGSTTFNVPDLRKMVVVGQDTSDIDFAGMGRSGGAKTHSHPLSAAGYALIRIASGASNVLARVVSGVTSWTYNTSMTTTNAGASTSGSSSVATELAGATDAGSTLQPYLVMNYIIKT